jgi:hypothetical protein
MTYVQCDLKTKEGHVDTRWIPEKLAKVGKIIVVKEDSSRWKITATYGKADERAVIEMRDVHKHHRKGTDI